MRLGAESLWTFSLYPEAAEGGGCLSVRRSVVAVSGGPPNVERAQEQEATALGAAALAGLGVGVWESPAGVARLVRRGGTFEPRMDRSTAEAHREAWRLALERALI